jgi:hypothetical protein
MKSSRKKAKFKKRIQASCALAYFIALREILFKA